MQRKRKLFFLQVFFWALLSVSVLIMPIMAEMWLESIYTIPIEINNTPVIINGILFWGSLLGLICFSIIFNKERRKSSFTVNKAEGYDRWGLIHFRQNRTALIADLMMCASLIGFVILCVAGNPIPLLTFTMLAVFIFSFGMKYSDCCALKIL